VSDNGILYHEEEVPFTTCLLGGQVTVKTIDDKEKHINLSELTPDGATYVFEEGMWNRPYEVHIKYQLPQMLTEKQKQLLMEFENRHE
jgi:DnaJ-class molecular chaperone